MYAIIRSGGKQFKVKPGEKLRVDSLKADVGAAVAIHDVLALHDGESLSLGKPVVESATVEATIVAHGRGKKIIVFKKKRRGGHHLKQGHRQDYTEILIGSFILNGDTLEAPAAAADPVKEETPAVVEEEQVQEEEVVEETEPVEEETESTEEETESAEEETESAEEETESQDDEPKPTE